MKFSWSRDAAVFDPVGIGVEVPNAFEETAPAGEDQFVVGSGEAEDDAIVEVEDEESKVSGEAGWGRGIPAPPSSVSACAQDAFNSYDDYVYEKECVVEGSAEEDAVDGKCVNVREVDDGSCVLAMADVADAGGEERYDAAAYEHQARGDRKAKEYQLRSSF